MLNYRVAFLLLSVGAALGSWPWSPKPNKPYYDLKDAEKHFAEFINKFGRQYESTEEYNQRFDIFKKKLGLINYWNTVHEAFFDINEFADKEYSERHFSYVPSKQSRNNSVLVKEEWLRNAPESLDYRLQGLVTEVKQQLCEDCYIFSAVGNIESQYAKVTGKLISLSEQQALDCVGNHPCQSIGGNELEVMQKLASTDGLLSEEDYPYDGKDEKCHPDYSKVKVKVTAGDHVDITDEESLKGALAELGPLSIALYVTATTEGYSGGIYKPTDCHGENPNHALLLVGYSTDENGTPYWIIKNSWGAVWGDNGYLLLERGKAHCSILTLGAANAKVASP